MCQYLVRNKFPAFQNVTWSYFGASHIVLALTKATNQIVGLTFFYIYLTQLGRKTPASIFCTEEIFLLSEHDCVINLYKLCLKVPPTFISQNHQSIEPYSMVCLFTVFSYYRVRSANFFIIFRKNRDHPISVINF